MIDLKSSDLVTQIEALKNKEISSYELTSMYLKNIQDNENLNCFISINESALEDAKKIDSSKEEFSHLKGIPIAHKDIFCVENGKTTCGSKMLENFISPYSSTVYEKLDRAGTVMLGKTNMDEFAMGSSNETSYFGNVKNPIDNTKSPGGSSGGSAAAVKANLCAFATGTDTGGSIRQPASFCGITGIKPTYGRVSRWGMIAFASSLDQAGVFTKTALDAAVALEMISGYDKKDSTSIDSEVSNLKYETVSEMDHIIGIPSDIIDSIKDPKVKETYLENIDLLKKNGVKTKEVELQNLEYSLPAYYVIAPAECSANLSRYDGIKFGYSCENPKNLEDLYTRTRSEGFGEEVKKRILIGTYCLSAGYFDAYYLKAQKIRTLVTESFKKAFKDVSVIAMPTCSNTAFDLESIQDPVKMYEQDIYTIPANLAGLPAISIPAGNQKNLPLGLQFIGNHLQESSILNISHKFQKISDYHV